MDRAATTRLWTRNFVLATVVNFFLSLIFYLLVTTLALYAVKQFHASESAAGLASGMFVIGAMVSRLFAGAAVDLVGHRRMVLVSLLAFVVASACYLPADNLGLLLVVRFVHGVAFGSSNTALAAAVQGMIPALRRGEGTGYFAMSGTLATAIGPFLALLLVDGPGYDTLFVACAVISVLALLLALALDLPGAGRDGSGAAGRRFHVRDVVAPAALPIAAVMLGLGVAYSGVVSFLGSYAEELDLVLAASGFFLAYAVVVLLSRPVAGRLQDHRGDNAVIYPAIASFAVGLLLLSLVTGPALLTLAGGFVGLGYGTLMSAAQVVAIKAAPKEHLGRAISTFCLLADAGVGAGPVLLGLLLRESGYRAMYLVLGGVVVLSAGTYYLAHGRRDAARHGAAAGRDAESSGAVTGSLISGGGAGLAGSAGVVGSPGGSDGSGGSAHASSMPRQGLARPPGSARAGRGPEGRRRSRPRRLASTGPSPAARPAGSLSAPGPAV